MRIVSAETITLYQPKGHGVPAKTGSAVQEVPRSGHLFVQAERIVIQGAIVLPSQSICLIARCIEFGPDESGEPAALNVDGRSGWHAASTPKPQAGKGSDGAHGWSDQWEPLPNQGSRSVPGGDGGTGQPGAGGDHGGNGGSAGSITLIAECVKVAGQLSISARGGAGGNGQPGGEGGVGGTGGPGNDIAFRGNLIYTHGTRGGDAGEGGPGGEGGKGGQGGDGGQIRIGVGTWDGSAANLDGAASRGTMGAPGAGGKGGEPGSPGKGGKTWGKPSRFNGWNTLPDGSEPDGAKKRKGADKPATVNDPIVGKQGAVAYASDVPSQFLGLFFSVSYATSLLTLAEDLYLEYSLSKDREALIHAHTLYQWLIDSLSLFDLPRENQWFYGAAKQVRAPKTFALRSAHLKKVATDLHLSEAADAIDSAAWAQFASIFMRATARMYDMGAGLDIFGMGPDDVPRLNAAYYERCFKEADTVLKSVGTALEMYEADEEKGRSKANEALVDLRKQVATETAIAKLIEAQKESFKQSVDLIHQANAEVERRRANVIRREGDFESYVRSKLHNPLLDLPQLLGVAESMSFTPNEDDWRKVAMFASQGGKVLQVAGSMLGIGDEEQVQNELMLGRLRVVTDDIGDLSDAYEISDQTVVARDPGATMLLAKESSLKSLLSPFHQESAARELEDAVHAFVSAVQSRNALLLSYNQQVARYFALRAEQTQTVGLIDAASLALARAAKEIVETSLVAPALRTAFQTLKRSAAHSLLMHMRAFRYWALRDVDQARYGAGISKLAASYRLTADEFASSLIKMKEDEAKELESRSAEPQKIPRSEHSVGVAMVFSLKSHPEVIQSLRTEGTAIIGLVPDERGEKTAGRELSYTSEIRVKKMRAWLRCPSATQRDLFTVDITHMGEETIVSRFGRKFRFLHTPVRREFKFYPHYLRGFTFTETTRKDGSVFATANLATMPPEEDPNVVLVDTDIYSTRNSPYSDVGLYAKWAVKVLDADPGLLSDVDALVLQFWGTFFEPVSK